jgi:signal peptidase I
MFSYFLPAHIRQGRNLLKDARKMLAYKRDLWSDVTISDYETNLRKLEEALRQGDKLAIEESAHALDVLCSANLPPPKDAVMRENVEVFLVAIVIALGVRTYFLQPFTIPTGSMQPTLNGVIGYKTAEPPPNPIRQVLDFAVHGRNWVNVVAEEGEEVIGVDEFKSMGFGTRFGFLTRTEIRTTKGSHVVAAMRETVERYFLAGTLGHTFKAGEPIVRGYIDTGDHVFVDKFSYHFRRPQRAEVFVFNTQNVPTNENRIHPDGPSQFYIKRLGGTPGDELRIDNPVLFVNGKPAEDPRFRRVIDKKLPGYAGYCNGREVGFSSGIMSEPGISFRVPEKNYFALGDNSYHSSDSRDWGPVPEQNIMGRGVFVYWPFDRHWGLIR